MRSARVRTTFSVVLVGGIVVRLVQLASQPLDNLDTYFHLRFGHEFLSGAWSVRDPGSVTSLATADWVPTQWLTEVVMAQTEDWFGLAGVAWLSGLLFVSLALVVYWACRRQSEPAVAALLVALTLIACTSGMSMRPQLISYLLVVVTTAAWQRARDTGRAPWVLVAVTWVWTMCHGMWPVGIVIGVVAVVGLALDRGLPPRTLARMAAVPLLSAAASLVSPVGPGLFPAVLRVGSRAKYFYEWDPPDYTKPWVATLAVILALVVVPRLRRAERVPWFDVLLLGLAVLCAVYSMRTVPVAACRPPRSPRPRCSRCSGSGRRCLVASGCSWAAAPWSRWPRSRSWCRTPRTSRSRQRRGSTAHSETCPRGPRSSTTAASAAT